MIELLIVLGSDAAEDLLKSVATTMGWAHYEYLSNERRNARRLKVQRFARITKTVILSVLAMVGFFMAFRKASSVVGPQLEREEKFAASNPFGQAH
jgi:hypothetical protein